MTSKTFSFQLLLLSLLLLLMMGAASLYAASPAEDGSKQSTSAAGSTQQAAIDVRGTWSGTFFSKHSNVAPFTMTVVINPDSRGHLIGSSTLNSDCLKGAQFEVTVTGSTVVLAGSDEEGDNITVRGTVDNTGTTLKATYILNGSATGRCETDDGTGSLAKR
jgi:type II secretory pathway pseudopilin PulG